MADAVATQTLVDGPKYAVMKFTNVSDGTGENAVTKVDVSSLDNSADGDACTGVVIERIWWQCIGMKVQILWDASSDLFCIELGENQSGDHDYTILVVSLTIQVQVKQETLISLQSVILVMIPIL